MTAEMIVLSQAGNVDATLDLINKFNPLLKKCAYNLNFDDAYDDLLIDFLELLKGIKLDRLRDRSEGTVISYIHKSIRSSYIKHSIRISKLRNISPYADLSESELYCLEAANPHHDDYFDIDVQCFDQLLTRPESLIIQMVYISGYSVTEIAHICGISRQAVNQTKKRALKKLESLYSDKLRNIK